MSSRGGRLAFCGCAAIFVIIMFLAVSAGFSSAFAETKLEKLSTDTFTNSYSEHRTEVEPHTYANGSTIVSAFQVARWFSGGGADIGFATSTDAGKTWVHGYLPGLTQNYKGGTYYTASDPVVAYDAKHAVWLINYVPITTDEDAVDVGVSSSTDGIHWSNPVLVDKSGVDDKNWITCDNSSSSPHYGNCYVEWDLGFSTGQIQMSTSSDGGKTWGAAKGTADEAGGIGGQPVVQPNGTVVVPIEAGIGISAFTSSNGGKSWSSLVSVSSIDYWGEQGGLRSGPLPSARVDGAGKVYLVWGDCRFRSGCTANDIVMSTSTNGTKWSAVTRIPIDPTKSTVDHFLPGLGVDRATSGKTAHLAMTYYYYPVSQCDNSCKLEVGFTVSQDGGSTWTAGKHLAGPMDLSWIAPSDNGQMVGDYLGVDFSNGQPFGVFAVAQAPGAKLNEAFSNRTLEATAVKRADGKYDVTVNVEARKFKADATGKETEVPVDDWIDIGAFAKPASGKKYGDTLYRQRMHITQRNSTFTFTTAQLPEKAGIDPFALLIDRIPDDNVKNVTLESKPVQQAQVQLVQ